jgi:hypothetical protein
MKLCYVNDELKRVWKERSWRNLRHYIGIYLERLRRTTRNVSQVSWSLGRDLNLGPPEYDTGVQTS